MVEVSKGTKIVKINVREVYGIKKLYPANREAELFCKIAKAKSLTADGLKAIRELGYSIHTDREGFDPFKLKGVPRVKKSGK